MEIKRIREQRGIAVVVPVKRLALAKSRTRLPVTARSALALDLARHTLAMVRDCSSISGIVVVTGDEAVAEVARGHSALVVGEPEGADLDVAARLGIQAAGSALGAEHAGVLVSDLPALAVGDLDDAISEYFEQRTRMYVADQHRSGTTFLVQDTTGSPRTGFGPGSARRHETLGFRHARAAAPGLRFDLDTPEDLGRVREQFAHI